MSDLWVVVELSHQGEKKTPQELRSVIGQYIGEEVEIFIPALTFKRRETHVTMYILEGYIFIASGLPTSKYFDIEDNVNVACVLTNDEASGRYLCYVENDVVEDLKEQLREQAAMTLKKGDKVRIKEGAYAELDGEILDILDDDRAMVHVTDLQSMEIIIELPFQFLEHKMPELDMEQDEEVII